MNTLQVSRLEEAEWVGAYERCSLARTLCRALIATSRKETCYVGFLVVCCFLHVFCNLFSYIGPFHCCFISRSLTIPYIRFWPRTMNWKLLWKKWFYQSFFDTASKTAAFSISRISGCFQLVFIIALRYALVFCFFSQFYVYNQKKNRKQKLFQFFE